MPHNLLTVDDATRTSVSLRLAPHFTSLALLAAALRPGATGLPDAPVRRLRRDLPVEAGDRLRMFGTPGSLTDFLAPSSASSDQGLDEAIDLVAGADEDRMIGDLVAVYRDLGSVPRCWSPLTRRPRGWLADFVDVERTLARHTQALWADATDLLDREIERVGTATVRGTVDVLLNTLSPDITFDGSVLSSLGRRLDGTPEPSPPVRAGLGGRRLVLIPMISGHTFKLVNVHDPDTVWICYPLPGRERLWGARPPAPRAAVDAAHLEAVLGEVRASVLAALVVHQTMGDLARRTGLAANTLSFHCARLEAAGLVVRTRVGRSVEIRRTARGEQLVDLLAG